MTLGELANLAEILGALTIISGVIFGLYQMTELRKQRSDMIASDLMKTFYSPELSHAVALIRALPDNASAEELRSLGPRGEQAAVQICTIFETMGVLVHERIAPYLLVEQLAGGMICVMHRKLAVWLDTIRLEQQQPSWAEWFQWLAEQLSERKTQNAPAHIRFRHWRP
ncbi:MAG: hypothetical protein DRR06_09050 [Gammaproteobacteria bacterium]|nr:MAG: hypothetical protein DRR06_09050 [Gammaproteobacteria bacterium]